MTETQRNARASIVLCVSIENSPLCSRSPWLSPRAANAVRPEKLDRVLGLILVGTALVWLWLAVTHIPGARTEAETGPRAFPVLLGVALAGLGLAMSLLAPASGGEPIAPVTRRETVVAAGTIGVLVLYAFLLERAGFLIATPIAIVLAMWGLVRVRRTALIAGLAIGFTVTCWAIFDALLGTPLPRGSWVLWLR